MLCVCSPTLSILQHKPKLYTKRINNFVAVNTSRLWIQTNYHHCVVWTGQWSFHHIISTFPEVGNFFVELWCYIKSTTWYTKLINQLLHYNLNYILILNLEKKLHQYNDFSHYHYKYYYCFYQLKPTPASNSVSHNSILSTYSILIQLNT